MYTVEDIDGVLKDGMLCCENCAFFFWRFGSFLRTRMQGHIFMLSSPLQLFVTVFSANFLLGCEMWQKVYTVTDQ